MRKAVTCLLFGLCTVPFCIGQIGVGPTNESTIGANPPPFGKTITPQGKINLVGYTVKTIKVDLYIVTGAHPNETVTKHSSYQKSRDGSHNGATWSAAAYQGLTEPKGTKFRVKAVFEFFTGMPPNETSGTSTAEKDMIQP
jgi:hypothetical protein